MEKLPTYRVVEKFDGTVRHSYGEPMRLSHGVRTIHESEVMPGDELLASLMAAAASRSDTAALGYDRLFSSFRLLEMNVEKLRAGKLPSLMARIGIDTWAYEQVASYAGPELLAIEMPR